jgi:transcription termination factor Rho
MPEKVSGILKMEAAGAGVLLEPMRQKVVAQVPAAVVREFELIEGAAITGELSEGGSRLASIITICGLKPGAFRKRTRFEDLTAIDPHQRFDFGAASSVTLRLIDLIAPIAKGTRGLIVSPPKAGKTTLLEQVAQGVRALSRTARIIVLLIDERPEEVTYFRRTVEAEVYASSGDQSPAEHVALAKLMLAHIRTELECGNDVVVLVDSLTRLVRAVNRRGSGDRGRGSSASRTLSGGLDAAALELPRQLFGLARNIEGGGSVTILATLLVDTGSRLDQVVYEEFKATGNCEIVLSRELAGEQLFPAVDIRASGTRKDDRFYSEEDAQRIMRLRRALASRSSRASLSQLMQLLERYPTNREFLEQISL